jgi:CubicO group peptidase (beta-lactamase class C family)
MKKNGILLTRCMAIGSLLVAMAILPGAGGAHEAYQAITPGYDRALQLLDKTENAAKPAGSRRCPDGRWTYLQKKREYGRFLDNYVAEKKMEFEKDEYLAYPPGYISSYSNCAVALLGIVIEEVSGVEFKTYVQNNICRPLGMMTSNFSLRDYMPPMLAKSYDSAGAESPFLCIRDEPAGSFISNTLEMSLFMRMILNGGKLFGRQILQPSTLEQMFVPQDIDIEVDFPNEHGAKWGLSWLLSSPALSYGGVLASSWLFI